MIVQIKKYSVLAESECRAEASGAAIFMVDHESHPMVSDHGQSFNPPSFPMLSISHESCNI